MWRVLLASAVLHNITVMIRRFVISWPTGRAGVDIYINSFTLPGAKRCRANLLL